MSAGLWWRLTANIFARIDCIEKRKIEVNGPCSDAFDDITVLCRGWRLAVACHKKLIISPRSTSPEASPTRHNTLFLNLSHLNGRHDIIYRFLYDRLNLTNVDEPFFVIDSLDSYASFDTFGEDSLRAVVYAVNQKGRSHGALVREFAFDGNGENRAGN